MKQTAVEWLIEQLTIVYPRVEEMKLLTDKAKQMEKEHKLDFGEFIIDELAPMAQNRDWVEERYNYFKSE